MLGRSGYVTEFLASTFGFENHNWLYGFNGIAIAQILAFAPISFMILDGALKSVHPSIEEASYTLRANPLPNFLQYHLPITTSGIGELIFNRVYPILSGL